MAAALSKAHRDEGLKAMRDENLKPSAKVRKQFKTGRPRRNRVLNAFSAIGELCDQLDRLRGLQAEAKLNPDDVYGALVWRAVDVDGLDKTFYRHLLSPQRVPAMLERLQQFKNPKILGLMFEQIDREEGKVAVWIFPFLTDQESLEMLDKTRKHYAAGGQAKLEN
jgi:hypothetical protein